jgi:hypothetical protein
MTPEVQRKLEGLVEELRALIPRLRQHDQHLATQLLEMAIIEVRSQMYGIDDDELQSLVDTLTGHASRDSLDQPSEQAEPSQLKEISARTRSPARVVAIGDIRRSKCKRRN